MTVILNTATGYRSIGHNAALAVGRHHRAARPVRQPDQRRLDEPGPHARRRTSWATTTRLVGLPPRARAGRRAGGGPDRAGARPAGVKERQAAEGDALAPVNRATRRTGWGRPRRPCPGALQGVGGYR